MNARDHLRACIEKQTAADAVLQTAEETAARGAVSLAEAFRRVEVHADLDAIVAQHRADAMRQGDGPFDPLPPALTAARTQRREAAEELDLAKAGAAILDGEASTARLAANAARQEARAAAVRVALADADVLAVQLEVIERQAAEMRAAIYSFPAQREPPPNLFRIVNSDPANALNRANFPDATLMNKWSKFINVLQEDPAARFADIEVPPAPHPSTLMMAAFPRGKWEDQDRGNPFRPQPP